MHYFKLKSVLLFISLISLTQSIFSQTDSSAFRLQNFSSVASPKGYSHAAIVDLGKSNMIILSGQVPIDKNGNLVGKNDFSKQAEQVFKNIKNIMSELGGTMSNVIKIGIYVVNMKDIQALRNVRDKYIDLKNPPSSTLVEVSKLYREDVLLEVEATAVIPKK